MNVFGQMRKCWRTEFLSPKDLLVRAAVISLLFLVVHLAGLREFTSVLNGTIGNTEISWGESAFWGTVYIFLYLAFVLGVPILLLAAAISAALQRLFSKSK